MPAWRAEEEKRLADLAKQLQQQTELDKTKMVNPVPGGHKGEPLMTPPTDDGLKKSKTKLDGAVSYVVENLDGSMPITSTAVALTLESPSAPLTTNWLLCLLVMAVESMSHPQSGDDSDG